MDSKRPVSLAQCYRFLEGLTIPYAVIGSTMLLRFHPQVLSVPPMDLDIVMEEESLGEFILHSERKGARVTCWGKDIKHDSVHEALDKIYVRATIGDYQVDATFSLPEGASPMDDIIRRAVSDDGVQWAVLDDVCQLMRIRGSAKDLQRLKRLNK